MSETFEQYALQSLNDPNSGLFQTTTVDRFAAEGEQDFADDARCILARTALSIVANTHTYAVSDRTLSIRRITWKGKKLDPLPQRNFREVFQSATQVGTPFWYVYNNIGLGQIRFFPTPPETIAAVTNDLYGSEIANRVIVDYFRTSNGTTFQIPLYIRRRLLKAYVLQGCFNLQGPGQNLKAAKYYSEKYKTLKDAYIQLLQELHSKPRKLVVNGFTASNFFPAQPILPVSRYGQSVDIGD